MKTSAYFILFVLLSSLILGFKASSSKNKLKRQDPFSTLFDVQKKFASITTCNRFDLTIICQDSPCVVNVKNELRNRKMINSIQTQTCSVWLSFHLKDQATAFSNRVNADISNNGNGINGKPSAELIGIAQNLINEFIVTAKILDSPIFNSKINIDALNTFTESMKQNLSKMKAFRDELSKRVGFITKTAPIVSPTSVGIGSCWSFIGTLIDTNTCTLKQ